MHPTPYSDVNRLLHNLLAHMQQIFGQRLIAVYLFGSLVTGDFDPDTSDIDVLAVTASPSDDLEFARLDAMHAQIVSSYPAWQDRIEIAYVAVAALQAYTSQPATIALISPGEPFHVKEAGNDWLINWWTARASGVALYGHAPTTVIAPISDAAFLAAVQDQAREWRVYVNHARHSRPYQGYVILTLCRALYACINREQVSKRQASAWVAAQFPQWSSLIQAAMVWRAAWRESVADPEATFPQTERFVHFAVDQIVGM